MVNDVKILRTLQLSTHRLLFQTTKKICMNFMHP